MRRIYETLLSDHFSHNRQMAFLSGPRQVGKTTLAEAALPEARVLNYDKASDARLIAVGADRVAEAVDLADPLAVRRGLVFDELHKFPKWKGFLKGFFDTHGKGLKIAVTGSARLDVYKRAFEAFFDKFFGWTLVTDAKCVRLYKSMWFNEAMRFRALMAGKEENYADDRDR